MEQLQEMTRMEIVRTIFGQDLDVRELGPMQDRSAFIRECAAFLDVKIKEIDDR